MLFQNFLQPCFNDIWDIKQRPHVTLSVPAPTDLTHWKPILTIDQLCTSHVKYCKKHAFTFNRYTQVWQSDRRQFSENTFLYYELWNEWQHNREQLKCSNWHDLQINRVTASDQAHDQISLSANPIYVSVCMDETRRAGSMRTRMTFFFASKPADVSDKLAVLSFTVFVWSL